VNTSRQFYLYILASRRHGTLYIGVTNDLVRRVHEHRIKAVPGLTKRYAIDRLVYFEIFADPTSAITRETSEEMAARLENCVDRNREPGLA